MPGKRFARAADRAGRLSPLRIRRAASAGLLALLLLVPLRRAAAEQRYSFDQRFGTIAFSVSHLGLFSSQGEFRRFTASLVLDGVHPEQMQISVSVEAQSVDMSWQQAADMLRSDDFLDVQRYPVVRFTSTGVTSLAPDRYQIHGVLQIRGVARPLVLSAQLTGRHRDPARHDELADFVVTGSLHRSAFGMTADEGFISDRVTLMITAHLELPDNAHAG